MNKTAKIKISGGFLFLAIGAIALFALGGKILSLFSNPIMVILIIIFIFILNNE